MGAQKSTAHDRRVWGGTEQINMCELMQKNNVEGFVPVVRHYPQGGERAAAFHAAAAAVAAEPDPGCGPGGVVREGGGGGGAVSAVRHH